MSEADLPPAPEVHPRWMWVWRCWHRLSRDRPYYGGGMGPPVPGNIPWWQLKLWAKDRELTKGQFMLLDLCVQRMDETFRKHFSEQQKLEAERSREMSRN